MQPTPPKPAGFTSREERRKEMLSHCLFLLEMAGDEYAIDAADWYEKREEFNLAGLGKRIRQEVEKRRDLPT